MPLHFDRVAFSYPRSRDVFNGFSFGFDARRTVLLGPNGAGKTTLLNLGASVLRPTRGRVTFNGLRAGTTRERKAYRSQVGWLPQQVKPIPGFTAREQVAYAGWLKGMSKAAAWREAPVALDRVALADRADDLVAALSGGQVRRVGLAQAIVHEARLLLLDEPTAGLDPAQRAVFRDLLADVSSDRQVIVSTHQTEDLGETYDAVVVLDAGRVPFAGPVPDFLRLAGTGAPAERAAEAAYAHLVAGSLR